ncbi:MAG: hypothetical protein ACUVRD_02560 [Bacteroidia bacterium]
MIRLAWRLLWGHVWRSQRNLTLWVLITLIFTNAAAVGTLSIHQAFQREIVRGLEALWGVLQITYYGEEARDTLTPIERTLSLPPMVRALPYIQTVGICARKNRSEGVLLVGVGEPFPLRWEKWLGDTSFHSGRHTFIGRELAYRLGVSKGDTLLLLYFTEKPRARILITQGIFESPIPEMQTRGMLVPIGLLQRLLGWQEDQVQGLALFPTKNQDPEALAEQIAAHVPPTYGIYTLRNLYPDVFDWLEMIQQNVVFILILLVLLCVVNVATAWALVVEGQKIWVTLLWALGTPPQRAGNLFLWQGVSLGLVASVVGNILIGALMAFQAHTQWLKLDVENYLVSAVPVGWYPEYFVFVNGGMVVLIAGIAFLYNLRKNYLGARYLAFSAS